MSFKILPRVGGSGTLAALIVSMTLTTVVSAAAGSEDVATPVAEPSQYSAAYAHPSQHAAGPYDGAVASTYSNVVRVPGQHGHAVVKAASHKTVDTPFSTAHKSDVRFINDAAGAPYYPAAPYAGPYSPYAPAAAPAVVAGPYSPYAPAAAPAVVAGPYSPYAPAAAPAVVAGPYPYAPAAPAVVAGPYSPYAAAGPYGPYATVAPGPYNPYAAGPYGPYAAAPIDKPYGYGPAAHSVSHASYSGPYGAHYSYKRRR